MKGVSNQFNIFNDIEERKVEVEEELSEDKYRFLAKDTIIKNYNDRRQG